MIELKDIQGNKLLSVPITQSCQKVEELMVADYIQLSWDSNLSDEIPLGAYIEYNGERYSLLEPYNPTQKNESDYTYTPKFESRVRAWGKKPFFFYSGESKEPDWTLTSNPSDFMRCVCDAIREETGESWTYSIDASLAASASLSFSSSDILSGLNQIADAFETEWLADKETNTIYLGLLSHGEEVTLEVGNNIGVPSIQNSKEGYYTRFYAFGSTRNITQDYSGSNTNNLVNKRLTLDPNKYPQGYKDIRSGLSEGEIFSKVLIFDNVYPSSKLSISGVRNRLMYRLDDSGDKIQLGTDENGNPIYDQYTIWYFRLEGFTFDWNNVIEGLTPSISFQSGALNGREFEIIYHDKSKKITTSDGLTFEVKEGDYEICFVEENNLIIPSMTGLIPNDGDKVIVFNIKMPSEYTQSAYIELEEELDKAIARMTSDLNNYSFKSNPVVFNESNPNLSIGRKVRYVNGSYSYSTRVIKLNTQLDFPIEQTITIGNEKVKGNTQQLREEVASANKDLNLMSVFNNMTQSLQQSYNRTQQMMLEGFAAIKNIWQIRETENGEKYIFSAYDVATQKGITMYHDGEMLNIPSLASGLPFDGRTIWYNPDTQQIEVIGGTGGGSGEGVSNFWDLSGIPSWITNSKPKYTYTEIEGTPDLSGFATQNWIISQGYASAEELKKYIPISGYTEVSGEKNFTGGLKVNGSPIYYDSAKKYWKLEGDLLVTGGVTMYGSDSSFTPSTIMDALLYDDTTLGINSNGQLYVKGGTSGGGLDITALQNYLTQNSYLNVTSGDNRYLKLSGGKINGTSANPLTINRTNNVNSTIELRLTSNSNIKAYFGWNVTDGVFLQEGESVAYIGVQPNKNPYYFNGTRYTLWHAGNDGSGSGLDADLLDGQEETTFAKWKSGISSSDEYRHIGYAYGSEGWKTSGAAMSFGANEKYFMQIQGGGSTAKEVFLYARYIYNGIYSDWKTIAFTDSNVASATQVMMNYSYNQDINYPLVFTSRDNIGVAQNATLYIDFSGRPTYNPKTDTLTVGNLSGNATYATNSSKLYSTDSIYSYGSANPYYGYLTYNQTYGEWDFKVSPNTPEAIHVYSSDKLRTARTIWGQSFDGTSDVNGNILLGVGSDYVIGTGYSSSDKRTFNNITIGNSTSGIVYNGGTWTGSTSFNAHTFITGASSNALVINNGGNVGIGTTSPNQKLHVEGGVRVNGQIIGANSIVSNTTNGFFVGNRNDGLGVTDGGLLLYTYGKTPISFYANGERMRIDASTGKVGIGTTNPYTKLHVEGDFKTNDVWIGSDTGTYIEGTQTGGLRIQYANSDKKYTQIHLKDLTVTINNNLLCSGGITMYSDQRKKTILNHVELSLKQIADAPLVEHYYNSDEKKTTHVGSIAQYWASINDWFCKLDSEGYYTMEIQNTALASAISIARELDRYESKTDKTIKQLKKRICQLEEEVKRFKSA